MQLCFTLEGNLRDRQIKEILKVLRQEHIKKQKSVKLGSEE